MQERYDELDLIISELDSLIYRVIDKDYIEQLQEIKYQAQNELEEIEPLLQEQMDQEERQANYEYERSVL